MDFRLGDLHARIATLEREKDALSYRNDELHKLLGEATKELESLQTQVTGAQTLLRDVMTAPQITLYQDVEDDLGQWR